MAQDKSTDGPEIKITKDRQQSEQFVETARALGADQDETAFKAKLAGIARQKPKDVPTPDKADKGKR